MLKKIILTVTALTLVLCGTALAAEQIYQKDNLKTWNRDKVGGGNGTLFGQFSFTRNDSPAGDAIKEIGWMTLQPGHSIGMHKHEANEDAYIIVSGQGVFTDTAGKETPVKGGDITIARKGDSHALKNTGTVPLIFR